MPLPEGNVLDFGNDVSELDGLIEQDGMINEFLAHNDLHLSVHLAQVSEGIPPPLPLFEGNIPDFGNDDN